MTVAGWIQIRTVAAYAVAAWVAAWVGLGCCGPNAARQSAEPGGAWPEQQLLRQSQAEQSALAQRSQRYQDPALEHRLAEILAKLLPPDLPAEITPRIILLSDCHPEAYSFPEGAIYLHTGLVANLQNEAELALLLAHELIHISRQHALRAFLALQQEAAAEAEREPLAQGLSWFQGLVIAAPDVPPPGENLLELRRRQEREADRLGLDLVIRANYDPSAALEIFQDLKHEDGASALNGERARALSEDVAAIRLCAGRRSADGREFRHSLQALLGHQAELETRYGRWQSALRFARCLAQDGPQGTRGHYLLGEIYRQRQAPGDLQQALVHYSQAIACDPSCLPAYKAAGILLWKQGRINQARIHFESALALAPSAGEGAYLRSYLEQLKTDREGENP